MRLQLYELWSLVKELGCFCNLLSGARSINVTLLLGTALKAASQQGQSHNEEDADRQENHQMEGAGIGPEKNGKKKKTQALFGLISLGVGFNKFE